MKKFIPTASFFLFLCAGVIVFFCVSNCITRSPLIRDSKLPYSCKMIIEGLHYTQEKTSSALGGVLVEKFGDQCRYYLKELDKEKFKSLENQ